MQFPRIIWLHFLHRHLWQAEPPSECPRSHQAADDIPARLDVVRLVPTAHKLFEAGLADTTKRTYRSGEERYLRFCEAAGNPPFPVREEIIILFISQLHVEGLAPGTRKSYLAAVRYEQIRRGLGDPEIYKMPRVKYVIKGPKRAKPGVVRRRLPITRS